MAEEVIEVTLDREKPGGTLGIAIDLWDGEVTIGTVVANGPADKEGSLLQGDIIRGVDGVVCGSIEEVTMNVMKAGQMIKLSCARRPIKTVLESSLKMKMPSGDWEPFSFQLLSNRVVKFDKLSPPQYSGDIHARTAQAIELKQEKDGPMLCIETGHKNFELKGQSKKDLPKWHLRLQEVIMLAEKVSNIAAGWLLKEELGGGADGRDKQLKNYYFILFSNGVLMRFTDEKTAKLGQALGFVDVVDVKEQSISAKQHMVRIKCDFDEWTLAATSKDNMTQWANSLKKNLRSKASAPKPTTEMILAQGWIDLPDEKSSGDDEKFVKHWFVLKNTVLAMYSEKAKLTASLTTPVSTLNTAEMKSAYRPNGSDYYAHGIEIEMAGGKVWRARAEGDAELRQLLSTLEVHCISGVKEEVATAAPSTKKEVVRSGYLFKKNLKAGGVVRMGKAWQRYFFLLETTVVTTSDGKLTSTAKLTCAESPKDEKTLVTLPLNEATAVKVAIGKTKGTERRVTLATPGRDFELGTDDKDVAQGWHDDLAHWLGAPTVESAADKAKAEEVLRSQWMEARIEVFELEDISDEELSRSNTIQQSVGSFARTFTLTGGAKKAPEPAAAKKPESDDDDDDDDDDEEEDKETFSWVFVALLANGELRQYKDEKMTEEVARMKLGKKVTAELLDDPPDTYEHAFRVKPEQAHADSWILCPDSFVETEEWIAELKA